MIFKSQALQILSAPERDLEMAKRLSDLKARIFAHIRDVPEAGEASRAGIKKDVSFAQMCVAFTFFFITRRVAFEDWSDHFSKAVDLMKAFLESDAEDNETFPGFQELKNQKRDLIKALVASGKYPKEITDAWFEMGY